MNLLPTHTIDNLFSSDEIDAVNKLIINLGTTYIDDATDYPDSGNQGRYAQKKIANYVNWDYHARPEIEKILTPKIEQVIQRKLIVTEAHILEATLPYLIHTDVVHHNRELNPEYTIIIPLDTYDSMTVCFNEWHDSTNDFEEFKKLYQGEKKLKLDPRFCVERLSHCHPKDLMYLTLHKTFDWNKGSMFAMDRRYFHCSDNFPRRGLVQKRAIVLWTLG
jgi:hypothetical protein